MSIDSIMELMCIDEKLNELSSHVTSQSLKLRNCKPSIKFKERKNSSHFHLQTAQFQVDLAPPPLCVQIIELVA